MENLTPDILIQYLAVIGLFMSWMTAIIYYLVSGLKKLNITMSDDTTDADPNDPPPKRDCICIGCKPMRTDKDYQPIPGDICIKCGGKYLGGSKFKPINK